MPHVVLEYSANVVETVDHQALFGELHGAVLELQAFPQSDIKSRAMRCTDFYMGDGDPKGAFVHLRFSLLAGRDISVRQRLVQTCMRVLTAYFARSVAQLHCQITVELREMDRATYAKFKADSP